MTFKLDNRSLIFLVSLIFASACVFVFGSTEHVDAWVAALVALATGGSGLALPQLLSLARHTVQQSAPEQTTRSSDAGSDTEGPVP
jgi:hypothetical protein